MRLFDTPGQELNNGQPFPAKYDRIHDLSITLQYRHNEKFDCGLSWVFSTGNTATLAMQTYEGMENRWGSLNNLGFVNQRNNFRLPSYHRMDASVNFHKQKKHGVRTWSISVYNLYNRKNPYVIYKSGRHHYQDSTGRKYNSALVQLSLFPIIPSVAYTFKF